jgi:hypothetical protein
VIGSIRLREMDVTDENRTRAAVKSRLEVHADLAVARAVEIRGDHSHFTSAGTTRDLGPVCELDRVKAG